MQYQNKERCEILAEYLVQHRATVRAAAARYSVSKSTVHKDVTERLRYVDPTLFALVKDVLEENKSERHLRGGEATKKKYMEKRQKK